MKINASNYSPPNVNYWGDRCCKAEAEIERLTARCDAYKAQVKDGAHIIKRQDGEIERLRALLKEIQAYSLGDPKPRHTWYYDRIEAALDSQQGAAEK